MFISQTGKEKEMKYLALVLCLVCLAIAARLTMPLAPESLSFLTADEIANALFARQIGVGIFILLGIGMFLGFYWEMKRR